jgi:Antitoxin Xre/MbcA/ParS C-terminal toxin-binding domain
MTTAVLTGDKLDLKKEATELMRRIDALQEELGAMLRGAGGIHVVLPELHDKASGRISAQKVARYMGVPLKRLAAGLQLNYKAVHRSPSAEALQPALNPVKRALQILHEFFNKPETVRIWLNTPHPDLDGRTALDLILANNPTAVLRILENAAAGVPV